MFSVKAIFASFRFSAFVYAHIVEEDA